MFGRKPTDKFEVVLGPSVSLDGQVTCDGSVRVEGNLKGSIAATGNVIVGKKAQVLADIRGNDVLVSGLVRGNIVAQGQLAILASGQVWGDIEAESFFIEEGAVFSGKSQMRGPEPALTEPGPAPTVEFLTPSQPVPVVAAVTIEKPAMAEPRPEQEPKPPFVEAVRGKLRRRKKRA